MSLGDHFKELRRRLVFAGLAVFAGAVVGWVIYAQVFAIVTEPITKFAESHPNHIVTLNYGTATAAFSQQLSLSIFIGIIISSPIWLYQVWAFVIPGLTKKEKRISMAFFAAAVPLFLAGVYLAHRSLPLVMGVLLDFAQADTSIIQSLSDYLSFVTRFILGFGLAFLLPVILVALNMIGILPVRALVKSWRVATFLIFVFAAMMMPTPDPYSMMLLALPLVVLFWGAVGVSALIERRKKRSRADWLDTADDEASTL